MGRTINNDVLRVSECPIYVIYNLSDDSKYIYIIYITITSHI